jgi:hypothetical protein
MMKGKIFLLIIVISSLNICHAQRALKKEEMEDYLPGVTAKFELSNQLFELKDTSVITSNAVYVLESKDLVTSKKKYTYLRFFVDGKAFISFAYLSYPGVEEFNDLSYGRPAFYTIKDGQVIVEFYMDKAWGVMSMVARPSPTGIEFYKLTGGPDIKTKTKEKSANNRTDNSFYKKVYTRLYNWPK